MAITIGKDMVTGKPITINLQKLIESRMLIQATAGGGKSYAIRKLLEETHGKVQQIVLDPEGEFASLREKYDYVLIAKDGDIKPDVKSAPLLARKLLENNVSAIIDLYELKRHERVRFVKDFLESMVNAPKLLWHPCLIILDEAHDYCSEKKKTESSGAVIEMASRGRKRGFCLVLATQRLAKLDKDSASEMGNKLMGYTSLDTDRKRVAEELGFTTKEQVLSLRNLEAGEFYVFGKAISREVRKIKIGKVKTTHAITGQTITVPKPATDKIKKVLAKLSDLPQKAEDELREKQDYLNKIRGLQSEIRKQKSGIIDNKSLERAKAEGLKEAERSYLVATKKHETQIKVLENILQKIKQLSDVNSFVLEPKIKRLLPVTTPVLPKPIRQERVAEEEIGMDNGITKLRAGAMKMLKAVVMFHPEPVTRLQVATLVGFSVKGGTFGAYLSELKKADWIKESGGKLTATDDGIDQAGDVEELPTDPQQLVDFWAGKFREGCGKMLRIIAKKYPNSITKEELAYESNFTVTGGTFGAYLSELRRNHLIVIEGADITATKTLFLE